MVATPRPTIILDLLPYILAFLGARPAVRCLVYCTSLESGMHAGSWSRILQAGWFQIHRKLTTLKRQSHPVNPTGSNRVTHKGKTRIFLLSRCHWKHWNHIHDWTLDQNPVPCHEKGLGTLHGPSTITIIMAMFISMIIIALQSLSHRMKSPDRQRWCLHLGTGDKTQARSSQWISVSVKNMNQNKINSQS